MSVTEQLERILKSPPLVTSPSLCRFLRYVVEETLAGRESQIKEQPLGVRVFDRGEGFNPRLDPIVRVQARNLRSRIAKYYDGPGATDPIRIELPKGTYVPVFRGLKENGFTGGVSTGEASTGEASTREELTAEESVAVAMPVSIVPAVVVPAVVMPVSVMPVPPPRSPVAGRGRAQRPRFLLATVVLVVILAGIAVLWITRIYAAPRVGMQKARGMMFQRNTNAACVRGSMCDPLPGIPAILLS